MAYAQCLSPVQWGKFDDRAHAPATPGGSWISVKGGTRGRVGARFEKSPRECKRFCHCPQHSSENTLHSRI